MRPSEAQAQTERSFSADNASIRALHRYESMERCPLRSGPLTREQDALVAAAKETARYVREQRRLNDEMRRGWFWRRTA